MMTFYAAAGSYQIRSEDGKNMPYIMRLGKLQPVSIPEFSLWSMLLWDVLTYEELHKKFYDKMEETEIEPSSFDKSLEMLVKRKLIIKGVGYTGADALYNMLSDTYVIPLRGVQGTRKLMNVAKLLKQKKVNFFEAVYLLQPEKSSVAERRIMKLVLQTPLSVPELVRCFENNVRDLHGGVRQSGAAEQRIKPLRLPPRCPGGDSESLPDTPGHFGTCIDTSPESFIAFWALDFTTVL